MATLKKSKSNNNLCESVLITYNKCKIEIDNTMQDIQDCNDELNALKNYMETLKNHFEILTKLCNENPNKIINPLTLEEATCEPKKTRGRKKKINMESIPEETIESIPEETIEIK